MKRASILMVVSLVAVMAGCGGGGGGGSDDHSTKPIDPIDPSPNQAPSIDSIAPASSSSSPIKLNAGNRQSIAVSASDPDNDTLTYSWNVDRGTLEQKSSQEQVFVAPSAAGACSVTITVSDGNSHSVSAKVYFQVGDGGNPTPQNSPPTVSLSASADTVTGGGEVTFTASASDPDGDTLTYSWIANGGSIKTDSGSSIVWAAPSTITSTTYSVTVTVSDGNNPGVSASAAVNGSGFAQGLTARYYKTNGNLAHPSISQGTLKSERIDPAINFNWGRSAPDPALVRSDGTVGDFMVTWSGYVKCEANGSYKFTIRYDDGARVYIWDDNNNKILLIDGWKTSPSERSAQITLAGGKWYPIQVEYFEDESSAYAMLSWTPPGETTGRIIPKTMLRSD